MPPAVGVGLGILGTGVGLFQQHKAGKAAEAQSAANARQAQEIANLRAQQQQEIDRRTMASARAHYGASGVDLGGGTPLTVLAESARQSELNNMIIKRGGELTAEAELSAGRAARKQARYGTYGTLLTGLSSANQAARDAGGWRSLL